MKFLYFNGLVVALLVAYLVWRPKRGPSRLKLRETSQSNKLEMTGADKPEIQNDPQRRVRQLNVFFQFNGHDFDAYEVLGLPAGTSFEKVEATYRQLIETSSSDSHEFYRLAFQAISKK